METEVWYGWNSRHSTYANGDEGSLAAYFDEDVKEISLYMWIQQDGNEEEMSVYFTINETNWLINQLTAALKEASLVDNSEVQ